MLMRQFEMCLKILEWETLNVLAVSRYQAVTSTRHCANCSSCILSVDPLKKAMKEGLSVSSF